MSLNKILTTGEVARKILIDPRKVLPYPNFLGMETTLTNNEIQETIKVIKSLENGEILFRRKTTKTTSQEGVFLNFLTSLMTANLPLIKSVLSL